MGGRNEANKIMKKIIGKGMKQKYSCEKHVLRQGIIKFSKSHKSH